jgi:hypothetical protein
VNSLDVLVDRTGRALASLTTSINGDVVATEPRPAGRKDGFAALQVQHACVAFRKVQIELR